MALTRKWGRLDEFEYLVVIPADKQLHRFFPCFCMAQRTCSTDWEKVYWRLMMVYVVAIWEGPDHRQKTAYQFYACLLASSYGSMLVPVFVFNNWRCSSLFAIISMTDGRPWCMESNLLPNWAHSHRGPWKGSNLLKCEKMNCTTTLLEKAKTSRSLVNLALNI